MDEAHCCPDCEKRKQQERENEEFNFAIIVSLIPLIVFTLFSQVGLF